MRSNSRQKSDLLAPGGGRGHPTAPTPLGYGPVRVYHRSSPSDNSCKTFRHTSIVAFLWQWYSNRYILKITITIQYKQQLKYKTSNKTCKWLTLFYSEGSVPAHSVMRKATTINHHHYIVITHNICNGSDIDCSLNPTSRCRHRVPPLHGIKRHSDRLTLSLILLSKMTLCARSCYSIV